MSDQSRAVSSSSNNFIDRPFRVSLFIVVLVAVWVALSARWHTALHHDMAEQFVWAHSWSLGYPKHPPLPTWLFMSAMVFLPAKPMTLYGLSALCIGAAGVFTYLAARELLNPRMALCVALLWGLQQPFSWRAWIYNHNTVLVAVVALTVFCVTKAVRRGDLFWWCAAGVAAGLAMSTKLQAIVPLLGVIWALWRSGGVNADSARRGVFVALILAMLVSAPALLWMVTGQANALTYASHQFGSGDGDGESFRLVQFVVFELRMLAPALFVLLVCVVRMKWQMPSDAVSRRLRAVSAGHDQAWIEGLLFVPVAFVLAMGILGGAKMHGQWGVQTFQFSSIALVIWFGSAFEGTALRRLIWVTGLVQLIALSISLSPSSQRLHAQGAVQGYPSRDLADRIEADWLRLAPSCALRYVSAPFFEGGQLAAYGHGFPDVIEDGDTLNSPWVDPADLLASGSVVMKRTVAELPIDVVRTTEMTLVPPAHVKGVSPVVWGFRLPAGPCHKLN